MTLPSPRGRDWLPNLAMASVAVLLTLTAAEVVLRATSTVERITIAHDPLLGFRGRPHAETIWTREMAGYPRVVQLNAGGFHDHERRHAAAPDTRRVLFVGDSFLESYQVDIDSSFAQRLGRRWTKRAAAAGMSVEAVNQGVHGYGLGAYALQVRERVPSWKPDGVVLCLFLGNDLHDNFTPVAAPAVPRFHLADGDMTYLSVAPAGARTWLRDHVLAQSVLVRFLWMRVLKRSVGAMQLARAAGMVSTPDLENDAGGRVTEMLKVTEHLLGRIAGDLRDRGVPLAVFVIPDPFHVHDVVRGAPDAERDAIETGVLQILTSLGLDYIYPRELFLQARREGKGLYRNGFGHFTDDAHRLVADQLEQPLWNQVAAPVLGDWTRSQLNAEN